MEENKGVLKRIQETLARIFKGKKYKMLTDGKSEINYENNIEEKNEFKERIANISKNPIEKEIDNISMEEEENIKDSMENFSFPANLDGYTFISDVVIDENKPRGSYVCYMVNSENINLEEGFPICSIQNKDKLRIVENYLNELKDSKGKYDKDSIKNIIENGFVLNNEEKFSVTENYHLDSLLKGIMNAQEENETITIPIDYVCKTIKGYKIEKSDRLIEIEEKQKKEQEEEEKRKSMDFDDIIKKYIVQGEPIDFNNMDERQIQILKEHYINIINNIKEKNAIDEYIQFGLEYIMNLARANQRYAQIINTYEENEKNLNTHINSTLKKIDLKKQQQTLKEIIVNNYLFNELKNKFSIFDKLELENDENIR